MTLNKLIKWLWIIFLTVTTLGAGYSFFSSNIYAQIKAEKKKDQLNELEKELDVFHDEYGKTQNQFDKINQKNKALLKQHPILDEQVDKEVANYIEQKTIENQSFEQLKQKLQTLPVPKEKLLVFRENKYQLINKKDDPTYQEAMRMSQLFYTSDLADELYQTLVQIQSPFARNHWPERLLQTDEEGKNIVIGTPAYDNIVGTNFSGKNKLAAYPDAKDEKAQLYLDRLEKERQLKKEEEKKKPAPSSQEAKALILALHDTLKEYDFYNEGTRRDEKGNYREVSVIKSKVTDDEEDENEKEHRHTQEEKEMDTEEKEVARFKVYNDKTVEQIK